MSRLKPSSIVLVVLASTVALYGAVIIGVLVCRLIVRLGS